MEIDSNPQQPQPQQQPVGPPPGPQPDPNMPQPQQQPEPQVSQQPMMPPQQPMDPNMPMQSGAPTQQHTDVLGIISVILIFFFPLVGAILGFVGMKKAKNEGYSGTLSKVGAIINTILTVLSVVIIMLLVLGAFQASQEIARELEENGGISQVVSQEPADFEVTTVSDYADVCTQNGWPTNATASGANNVVGVYGDSSVYRDFYSSKYIDLDSYEDIDYDNPTVADYVVCMTTANQEPVSTSTCELEIDDQPVQAPMNLRPYVATVYSLSSKSQIGSFTAQAEDRCPFFVSVDSTDNSFDADVDEASFNAGLASVLAQ